MIQFDKRDTAHNIGFYCFALFLNNKKEEAKKYFNTLNNFQFANCKFWYKNEDYKWSNAQGYRKKLNELFDIDAYCGSNKDQIEPCLLYEALANPKNNEFIEKIAKGLKRKFFFYGDNLENSILTPRVWSIIFRNKGIKWSYWLLDFFEIITPLEKYPDTTRTIRDYLFLVMVKETKTETVFTRILKWKHRLTNFDKCFSKYFSQNNNIFIYTEFKNHYNLVNEVQN